MLEACHPDQTKGFVASTFFYESRYKNVFRFNLWNPQRDDVRTWIQTNILKNNLFFFNYAIVQSLSVPV